MPSRSDPPSPVQTAAVDPQILRAMQAVIQPVLDAQVNMQATQQVITNKLDAALEELKVVHGKVNDLETAVQHTSDRMDDIVTETLPQVTRHISAIATALAMRQLDLDVHQRKWSLVIDGIDGVAKETEANTRKACLDMAKDKLGIAKASETRISACHRLSPDANSAIYIRFSDLQQRNNWLSHGKNLAGKETNISISPDLPPILRKLKKDLLQQRKDLDKEDRKHSSVRYLKQWPFLKLKIKDKNDIYPSVSQQSIVSDILGVNPLIDLE